MSEDRLDVADGNLEIEGCQAPQRWWSYPLNQHEIRFLRLEDGPRPTRRRRHVEEGLPVHYIQVVIGYYQRDRVLVEHLSMLSCDNDSRLELRAPLESLTTAPS